MDNNITNVRFWQGLLMLDSERYSEYDKIYNIK